MIDINRSTNIFYNGALWGKCFVGCRGIFRCNTLSGNWAKSEARHPHIPVYNTFMTPMQQPKSAASSSVVNFLVQTVCVHLFFACSSRRLCQSWTKMILATSFVESVSPSTEPTSTSSTMSMNPALTTLTSL